MENVFVWQQKIITHIIYATKRGFSIPPSVLVVLKRAGQRENSNEFERKANAEDHPSFSTRGDTQIPDRSLLFQNACQRVKHSLRDLEPTSYSTTAETKKKAIQNHRYDLWMGTRDQHNINCRKCKARPEIRPRYTFPGSWTYGKPGWPSWPLPLVFNGNAIASVCMSTSNTGRGSTCLHSRKLQQQLMC